jgi:hypothetical protein
VALVVNMADGSASDGGALVVSITHEKGSAGVEQTVVTRADGTSTTHAPDDVITFTSNCTPTSVG